MDIFAGGAVSGAAMNPSRWFGVAIVQGDFTNFWIWIIGPIIGAIIVLGLQHWLSSYTEYWGLVLGLLFIVLITGAREGIVGIAAGLWRWQRRWAS